MIILNFETLKERKTRFFFKSILDVVKKNNKTKLIFIFDHENYAKILIFENISHIKCIDTRNFVKRDNI